MPIGTKAQRKPCNRNKETGCYGSSEEKDDTKQNETKPKIPKIIMLNQNLKSQIMTQTKRERQLREFTQVLEATINEMTAFSSSQLYPINKFYINPILINSINYYAKLRINPHIIGYGGAHTFPPKDATQWTPLAYDLFIKPLQDFIKARGFNENWRAFSIQAIFYKQDKKENDTISNHTRTRKKRNLDYESNENNIQMKRKKKEEHSNLSQHKDPQKYILISGTTLAASSDGECILSLTDGHNNVITSKKLLVNESYVLVDDTVKTYLHKVDVVGKRLAVVVRFIDFDILKKENYTKG